MEKLAKSFGKLKRSHGVLVHLGKIPLVFIALIAVIGVFTTCNQPTSGLSKPPVDTVASMNRYIAEPSPYTGNDTIRYSYTYGGYDFYYIHLGQLKNIPMFNLDAQYFGTTSEMTYEFSTETTSTTTIEDTVSKSDQKAVSVVDQSTNSTTIGGKLSTEIDTKFSLEAKTGASVGGVSASVTAGFEQGIKVDAEASWNYYTSNSSENGFQETTSLTNTKTNISTYTEDNRQSFTWPLSKAKGDRTGWYRYTLFTAADVYLYVIKDASGVVYYEFQEYVKPNVRGWMLDYCEDMSFEKSDATNFDFDTSILDNLPTPSLDLNPGTLGGNVEINGTAKVGETLTANIISLTDSSTGNSLIGSPDVTYLWMQNGTTPIGSNSPTYKVQSEDAGSNITVTIGCTSCPGSVISAPASVPSPLVASPHPEEMDSYLCILDNKNYDPSQIDTQVPRSTEVNPRAVQVIINGCAIENGQYTLIGNNSNLTISLKMVNGSGTNEWPISNPLPKGSTVQRASLSDDGANFVVGTSLNAVNPKTNIGKGAYQIWVGYSDLTNVTNLAYNFMSGKAQGDTIDLLASSTLNGLNGNVKIDPNKTITNIKFVIVYEIQAQWYKNDGFLGIGNGWQNTYTNWRSEKVIYFNSPQPQN